MCQVAVRNGDTSSAATDRLMRLVALWVRADAAEAAAALQAHLSINAAQYGFQVMRLAACL